MDNEELVSYYLKRSQDWIFIPQFRTVKIEDDEILDLDSMNLDSNEDTWLCSSEKSSVLKDSSESLEHEELEKEFGSSSEVESKKEKDASGSPLSPLLGPDDFHHPSFLNSIDEMSDTALEDLLRTPLSSRAKGNLLRKALANSHSHVGSGNSSSVGSVSAAGTMVGAAGDSCCDDADSVFKKPSSAAAGESVAKSYILHSVENKLFTLAEANAAAELIKSRDLKNAEIARKTAGEPAPNEADALGYGADEEAGAGVNDENAPTKGPAFAWHSTPHQEAANRPPARRSFPQQPTPILLNRYLKHKQSQAAETDCALSRLADEEEPDERPERPSAMNVSYVKYAAACDEAGLPRIADVAANGLRSSFSKSDDVLNAPCDELNSTYSLRVDDDAASCSSESSASSMSHKLTLSIREVQKMADLQERDLKKQVYSSYYAGSSKSSEVSSSNESVSTYGALSNSNEGSINVKPTPKIVKGIQPPKQRLCYARELPPSCSPKTNSRISMYAAGKVNLPPSKPFNSVDVKAASVTSNETKANLTYKSRLQYSSASHSPSRKTQASAARPSTVPAKPILSVTPEQVENANEMVFVHEIKDTSANKTVSGPASHIPRPASKIPTFRSSSSRTRFGKS